jgi:hypothetical protein
MKCKCGMEMRNAEELYDRWGYWCERCGRLAFISPEKTEWHEPTRNKKLIEAVKKSIDVIDDLSYEANLGIYEDFVGELKQIISEIEGE